MRGLRPFLRDTWQLAKPYFQSEESEVAWALLIATIVLSLMLVGMDVILNFWNNQFYTALQDKNWTAFIQLLLLYRPTPGARFPFMPGFCAVCAVYIAVAVYRTYLTQWLQMRWRRWLTAHLITDWMQDRAYYRISLSGHDQTGTDNPDQRIAEDLRAFVNDTLSLGLDLMSNIVSLFSFLGILWGLSGPIRAFGLTIPGYMVWVALVYAILGTVLAHLIGRPLAMLNFQQQRCEADFRFSLIRIRENTEGIALYGGEAEEKATLQHRFGAVVLNWWAIMRRTKALNSLVYGYQQVAVIFPYIVAAPRYFSGAITLGGLTQTSGAFGQVQSALSFFVSVYQSLASWSATVERLASFQRAIVAARAMPGGPVVETGDTLALRGLTLNLPDGTPLLQNANHQFEPARTTVISGPSGAGKSTLFRALAGIWPFGGGSIATPPGRSLFLPQRPYIPLGTLRRAVAYPGDPLAFRDDVVAAALRDAGLDHLVEKLDEETNWSQRLSGGEQQRLALARALLLQPDTLFMDEATANLDPAAQNELRQKLREKLPNMTIVAISHHPAAEDNATKLVFDRAGNEPGRLAPG